MFCVDVKHTPLHGQGVTTPRLSRAWGVAKERRVPGYGAGKGCPTGHFDLVSWTEGCESLPGVI